MRRRDSSTSKNRRAIASVILLLGTGGIATLGTDAHEVPSTDVVRTTATYAIPRVNLVDMHGSDVQLDRLLAENKPAIVEFFFTSCTSICGLQSLGLSDAQAGLAATGIDCVLLSISIDPEFDTPERMLEYAANFEPGPNWHLLTARQRDIEQVMSAFDARYPGNNKMLHQPLTYIRPSPDRPWHRIEGLLGGNDLVAEFTDVLSQRASAIPVRAGYPR